MIRTYRAHLLAVLVATGFILVGIRSWEQKSVISLIDFMRDDPARAAAIEIRSISIDGAERRAIASQESRQFTAHDVPVFADTRLTLGIGVEEDVWNLPGDGVLFRVQARQGKKKTTLFTRYVDAKNKSGDRRWIDVDLPLAEKLRVNSSTPSFADLIFSTTHGFRGDGEHDSGVWANPRIARRSVFAWPSREPPRPPNVLLLSIDTLRADHVGAFGYERPTTPAIDEIAAQGFKFHRAHAPANHTMESHMSVLTGLYSTSHGVRRIPGKRGHQGVQPLPEQRITLAEMLQANGYATAGFVYNCLWLGRRFGFAQGFDKYTDARFPAETMNDREIFPWLDFHRADPFFLFVHYYDVHSDWKILPYDAPPRFKSKFVATDAAVLEPCDGSVCATKRLVELNKTGENVSADQLAYLRSLYDAGVAATDHQVGRLIDKLRSLDILDDTLVVVMADHGEEFREHGNFIHRQHYQEILRVPLIFRLPAAITAGGESHLPVPLIDVAPTILDLLGLPFDDPVQGRSLLPLLRGDELAAKPLLFFGPTTKGIINWPWKMIHRRRRTELYNLDNDPREQQDLSQRESQRVAQLQQLLEREQSVIPQHPNESDGNRPLAEPSESELERLRALGYLQ